MLISGLMWAITAFWLLLAGRVLWNALSVPRLPVKVAAEAQRPKVSVVIAARDEAARVEQTVRGLIDQQGVELQLVVVDDRSKDATPQILARLQAEHPRVDVIRIDELPSGWLGKCHACAQGAARAKGEWILFTDADIHMKKDLLGRAVAAAMQQKADHVALLPGVNCTGLLTRGSILAFGQCFSLYSPAAEINRDKGTRAIGVGAFNLVRAEAYRAVGGHEPLKMEVVDDVKLGLILRRAGFRQRVYNGCDEIEAEWAHSIPQVIRALEKNWFAGVEYSLPKGLTVLLFFSVIWFGALAGPFLDPISGSVALAAFCTPVLAGFHQARQCRWPLYTALLIPLGFLVFSLAGVHSMWKTLSQGGVRWRETFYSLAELRAGIVR